MFVFIVYRTVSYVFERLFKLSGTGPDFLKSQLYTLIRLYLLTGDIFEKLRHPTYALGIVTHELKLFSQRQNAKELYAIYPLKTNYLDISITVLKFLK